MTEQGCTDFPDLDLPPWPSNQGKSILPTDHLMSDANTQPDVGATAEKPPTNASMLENLRNDPDELVALKYSESKA